MISEDARREADSIVERVLEAGQTLEQSQRNNALDDVLRSKPDVDLALNRTRALFLSSQRSIPGCEDVRFGLLPVEYVRTENRISDLPLSPDKLESILAGDQRYFEDGVLAYPLVGTPHIAESLLGYVPAASDMVIGAMVVEGDISEHEKHVLAYSASKIGSAIHHGYDDAFRKHASRIERETQADRVHDIKNEVSPAQGYAELSMRFLRDGEVEKALKMAELVYEHSRRLTERLEEVREDTLLGDPLRPREIRLLDDVISPALERSSYFIKKRKVDIDLDDSLDRELTADPSFLGMYFRNAFSNLRYAKEGTRVNLWLDEDQGGYRVHMSNIAEKRITGKDLSHLLEFGYRGEMAERSGMQGTGIGLSTMHRVARKHGGDLYPLVDETEHGQRVTFSLELPQ